MRQLSRAFCFGISLAPIAALATIGYTVSYQPGTPFLRVKVDFVSSSTVAELQMPNWAPGAYVLSEPGSRVRNVAATVDGRTRAEVLHPRVNTWKFEAGRGAKVSFQYEIPISAEDDILHYSGPQTYMYVVGRKEEDCLVEFQLPAGWPIATGLDAVPGKKNHSKAYDYDFLADCPVTAGKFVMDTYTVFGKKHIIATRGAARNVVDRQQLIFFCKNISWFQGQFFGGLPFKHYVWHFSAGERLDGGGGLEHLNSTTITTASGMGPGIVSVYSHEYFHLWNVKRIRSSVLGPFDYTQLPVTGALWWLEGTTDYYAHLLPVRYGMWEDTTVFNEVLSQWNGIRNNPARLEVSPDESSRRVREAANGRGNSNGWRISYYTLGWLCGFVLDVEIRARTGGKHSLDDVMLALWNQCKDGQPGFAEDEIRKQCLRFGGEGMADFYDSVIMKAGELPIEQQLAKLGLAIRERETQVPDFGFAWNPVGASNWANVTGVRAAANGKVVAGDKITGVNGKTFSKNTTWEIAQGMRALDEAKPVTLAIKRGEESLTVVLEPTLRARTIREVVPVQNASAEAVDLRLGWLYGPGKKPRTLPFPPPKA